MNDGDVSAIVDELAVSILKQEEATGSREIRKHARNIERLEAQLLRTREGVEQLSALLGHPEVLVRADVATMLLGTLRHDEAMEVLQELAAGDGLIAWGTGERIKEWKTHPERYTSRLTDESRKPDIP